MYIARSVSFNETEFPYLELFPPKHSDNSPTPIHIDTSAYTVPLPMPQTVPTPQPIPTAITLPKTQPTISETNIPAPQQNNSLATTPTSHSHPIIPITDFRIELPLLPSQVSKHAMTTRSKT